jgi:allophanate hydrolase subunit 1
MAKSHLYQMHLGSTYFVSALGAEGGPAYDSGAWWIISTIWTRWK